MRFAMTEDQQLFTAAVRELLADQCPPDRVRAAWDAPADNALWTQLAQMGVVGMLAPEAAGGMGMGALDLHPLLIEAGRVAMTEPIVDTSAVAVPLLAAAGHDAVAGVAAGDQSVAVGFHGDPVLKPTRFYTTAARLAELLDNLRCPGDHLHARVLGRPTGTS